VIGGVLLPTSDNMKKVYRTRARDARHQRAGMRAMDRLRPGEHRPVGHQLKWLKLPGTCGFCRKLQVRYGQENNPEKRAIDSKVT
jgi:hypothetical protein